MSVMRHTESSTLTELRQELVLAASGLSSRNMAILGEGNLSARVDDEHFLVKASGTAMSQLKPEHLVLVRQQPMLELVESDREVSDEEINELLLGVRVYEDDLKPSVETVFHAWLLTLPGVHMVGHNHAMAVNRILCSPRKIDFAEKRMFPDQVVFCGARSVLVPYVDPGVILAREIAHRVVQFMSDYGKPPKNILLENHGLITLGSNRQEITGSALMAEKSAEVFLGASLLDGPIYMHNADVERIDNRMDEAYRQKIARETL